MRKRFQPLNQCQVRDSNRSYYKTFPGVKRRVRGADHLFPFNAEVKERVELYGFFPSVLA